jgi:formate dehydrogenase assembly factor FdhD
MATTFANVNKSDVGTFTVTIASPGVFTKTGHGYSAGDIVVLTTTDALPTGLSANTNYYVISAGLTTDAFQVSATSGGSAINTSGSQSGTHSIRRGWGNQTEN